jgi:hypothetical protein
MHEDAKENGGTVIVRYEDFKWTAADMWERTRMRKNVLRVSIEIGRCRESCRFSCWDL